MMWKGFSLHILEKILFFWGDLNFKEAEKLIIFINLAIKHKNGRNTSQDILLIKLIFQVDEAFKRNESIIFSKCTMKPH